ncbi:MAG: DUF2065 family protein [Proteobacteria bacterium]|nr:DUF2065 family protein [Pseudomonadota bacterium]
MSDFIVAIGLVFVVEGIVCAAFPQAAKRAAAALIETPEAAMRIIGMVSAVLGVVVVWLVRG